MYRLKHYEEIEHNYNTKDRIVHLTIEYVRGIMLNLMRTLHRALLSVTRIPCVPYISRSPLPHYPFHVLQIAFSHMNLRITLKKWEVMSRFLQHVFSPYGQADTGN